MITDSFDNRSEALIRPSNIYAKSEEMIETCIATFSYKLVDELLTRGMLTPVEMVHKPGSANGEMTVYRIKDTDIGLYKTPVGAPGSVGIIEEVHHILGTRNFIVFGSCGTLDTFPHEHCIIPTAAYRDEGTGYHYVPASDYISIKNADKVEEFFKELGIPYLCGKTWTTDAFYRETVNHREKRKSEGCVCVEMECSAMQAVCDFLGINLYSFFYTADSLAGESWDKRILGAMEMDARLFFFNVAKALAERV